MKLNIYKTQKEIAKTYEVDNYDLMYGTVQDILEVLDDVEDLSDGVQLLEVINKNRTKLEALMMDIFADEGLTQEEMRNVKVKELIPVFIDLFQYVKESFATKN